MHLVQLPAADNLPTPRYGSKHRSSIRQREGLPQIEIKETTFFICWKYMICSYELGQMSSIKIDYIVRICHVAAWQEGGTPAILECTDFEMRKLSQFSKNGHHHKPSSSGIISCEISFRSSSSSGGRIYFLRATRTGEALHVLDRLDGVEEAMVEAVLEE